MWVIFALLDLDLDLDPDPDSESGSTDPIESGPNPDPDPQPWLKGIIFSKNFIENCAFYGQDTEPAAEPELVKSRNLKK